MDCPRCGGPLEAFVLRDSRAVRCGRCGWVGTEASLADIDSPDSTVTWEDALAEVSVRAGSVDRRSDDLPAVATANASDSFGQSSQEVTRLPDAPPFEGWNDRPSNGDAGTDPDADAGADPAVDAEPDQGEGTGTDSGSDADGLETISGDPRELEQLRAAGIETVEELAAADHVDIADRIALSGDTVRTYVRRASIQVVTEEPGPE